MTLKMNIFEKRIFFWPSSHVLLNVIKVKQYSTIKNYAPIRLKTGFDSLLSTVVVKDFEPNQALAAHCHTVTLCCHTVLKYDCP